MRPHITFIDGNNMNGSKVFRVGLIQLMVSTNKNDNLHRIQKFVAEAAQQGAKLISLPVSHFSKQ